MKFHNRIRYALMVWLLPVLLLIPIFSAAAAVSQTSESVVELVIEDVVLPQGWDLDLGLSPMAQDEILAREPALFPRLALTLTSAVTTAVVGDTVQVTLEIANSGDARLKDYSVGIWLPQGVTFQKARPAGQASYDANSRILTFRPRPLSPGQTRTYTFDVTIENSGGDTVLLTATGSAPHLERSAQAQLELTITGRTVMRALSLTGEDPTTKEGWTPQYNEPVVSTFSGAATFSYGISTPPGRRGLQPSINLNYNSKRVDGILTGRTPEWVGLGWNIDAISIVRTGIKEMWPGNQDFWLTYDNEFQLTLNGASYDLKPAAAGQLKGRYYADGAPGLYLERINDCSGDNNCYNNNGGSRANKTTEYWIVKTSDGTTYRLGHNSDSEQVIFRTTNISVNGPYSGPAAEHTAFRWRVDQIVDVYGNEIEYQYIECRTGGNNSCIRYSSGPNGEREIASYLDRIYYNRAADNQYWLTEIRFVSVDSGAGEPAQNQGPVFVTRRILTNIQVWWHDTPATSRIVAETRLNYSTQWLSSAKIYLLKSIEPYGLGGQSSGSPLPGFDFTYQQYNNKDACLAGLGGCMGGTWENDSFPYWRLVTIANGYGGRTEFSYESDGPGRGDDWQGFYNYRVKQKKVYDGLSSQPIQIWDYSYGQPCYNQWGDNWPATGGNNCADLNGAEENGSLVGHAWTKVKLLDGNSVAQSLTLHQYVTGEYYRRGREWQTIQYEADGVTEVGRVDNVWGYNDGTCQVGTLPATVTFVCLQRATTTITDTASNQSITTRQDYRYETFKQGGDQYGFKTQIDYFDNAGQMVRREVTRYQPRYVANAANPEQTVWLIVPWISRVEDGGGNYLARTLSLYDGQTDPDNQTLDKGELTATRTQVSFVDYDGSSSKEKYQTIDTGYGYDAYGNQTTIITYDDYGAVVATVGSGWDATQPALGDFDGTGQSATTISQIGYGNGNKLFPETVTNAKGHQTRTSYDASFPWLPAAVTDVNNGVTVAQYRYDGYGRLTKLIQPGDSDSSPTMRYEYWDDPAANGGVQFLSPLLIAAYPKDGQIVRQFYDGLGRVVQMQAVASEIDGAGTQDVIATTEYDARGQVVCQTTPYGVTPYVWDTTTPYRADDCFAYPHTTSVFDEQGRPVKIIAPDNTENSAIMGYLSVYNLDSMKQIKTSFFDAFGRLTKIDESVDAFQDDFQDGDFSGWANVNNAVVNNGVVEITGNGTWSPGIRRNLVTDGDGGVSFSFRSANSNLRSVMALHYGTWNTSNYRRWSIEMNGGQIELVEYTGSSYSRTNLLPFKANTWYRTMLRGSQSSAYFTVLVWEEGNPANRAEIRLSKDSAWKQPGWQFLIQVNTNGSILEFDDYVELEFNRTTYAYDTLNNLTSVTDAAGSVITMTYDALGRKTTMNDPDMGPWSYEYNPAGSLTRQTDAKGQAICFAYDELNRLTGKAQDSSPQDECPAPLPASGNDHLASYVYDSAANYGVGRLAQVSWGPTPAQNFDLFDYDARGRVVLQTRTIDNRPYTMQTTAFDGQNRPTNMIYPNGETIAMTYDIMGADTLQAGPDMLVTDIRHNIQGQMTQLIRGNNKATAYDYFDAGGNFRLEAIRHGTANDALPDFSYQYDAVGNIEQMTAVASGETDTQTFSYDSLNRLLTADAVAGPAPYNHTFDYDAIGNMTSFNGDTYDYTPALNRGYDHTQPHAVTSVGGSQTFSYDANGNMMARNDTTGNFTQAFDVENRLVQVTNTATGDITTFVYDAGGSRVKTVQPDETQTFTPFPGYEVTYVWSAPTLTLTANGETNLIVPANTSFTLAWDTQYSGGCTASGNWSGSKEPDGSQVIAGFASGARTYSLTCTNANGSVTQTVTVSIPLSPPTVSLTANNRTYLYVAPGAGFTLRWSSTSAAACTASGSWSGGKPLNGSASMPGFSSGTRSYTLTCTNAAGSATKTVTVRLLKPSVTLTANDRTSLTILPNTSFTLRWSSSYAASCAASNGWSGSKPLSGSQTMPGIGSFETHYYTLTCTNSAGSTVRTVTVTSNKVIEPPPGPCKTCQFRSEPLGKGGVKLWVSDGRANAATNSLAVQTVPPIVIERVTYSLAGQAVAVRVSGDPDPANNGLFYLYNDHLGSAGAMQISDGSQPPIVTQYTPFGGYRPGSGPNGVTDRGFTGHVENAYIKLIDMQARWYDPAIGRFISPDTIIPDPTNPQSFNRYSYVYNNPVNFTDPTGHCAETGDDACWSIAEQLWHLYDIDLEFLGLMEYDQLTFFQDTFGDLDAYQRNYIIETIQLTLDDDFAREQIFERGNWDVFGVRLDLSGSFGAGGNVSFDFLWNFNSREFSILANLNGTFGAQAGVAGAGGIFLGFNAPDNSAYTGWGTGFTFGGAIPGVGGTVQGDFSGKILGLSSDWHIGDKILGATSNDTYNLTVMYSAGVEAELSYSIGYTWMLYTYLAE